MKKEFDLKIDGGTLESIKIDSSNSLIIATYKRDVDEFKAGDILIDAYDEDGAKFISILKDINEDKSGRFSAHLIFDISDKCMFFDSSNWDHIEDNRLATEEEKQLLFDALKKEGFRWNADKLEIEKIAPKFPTKLKEIDRQWYIDSYGDIHYLENDILNARTPNHLTSKESAEQALEFIKLLAFRDAIWEIEGKPENEKIDISFNFKTNEGVEHFEKMKKEIESGNL